MGDLGRATITPGRGRPSASLQSQPGADLELLRLPLFDGPMPVQKTPRSVINVKKALLLAAPRTKILRAGCLATPSSYGLNMPGAILRWSGKALADMPAVFNRPGMCCTVDQGRESEGREKGVRGRLAQMRSAGMSAHKHNVDRGTRLQQHTRGRPSNWC